VVPSPRDSALDEIHLRLRSRLRVRSLIVFHAVVEHGGVLRAAAELGLPQPAISRTIRDLERTIGSPLLRKSGRHVVPTESGEILFRHAKRLLAGVRDTAEDLQAGGLGGHVRVGVLIAAASRLLPYAIKALKKKHQDVTVTVFEGGSETLLPALSAGEIDLLMGRISMFDQKVGFRHEVLYEEPVVACARAEHPLFKRRRRNVAIEDLNRYPWILPPPWTALRREIEQALSAIGSAPPRDVVESVSVLTNRTLLLNTDFIAFFPRQIAAEDVALGLLRTSKIPFDIPLDPVGMTFRAGLDLKPIVQEFALCARKVAIQLKREGSP
jgi:DNA-binding transcriptional LysR family regulator